MQNKESLEKTFQNLGEKVDPVLKEVLIKGVSPKFKQLALYPISTGGKRLRPVLCLLSCLSVGGKIKDAIYPAVALEILHNYTLIVDDTIDHGLLRRGKPTVQAEYGDSIGECVGSDFAASMLQASVNCNKPKEIANILANALKVLIEGEILDILFERIGRENEHYVVEERPKDICEMAYMDMIAKKTAFLLKTCCHVGGILGGANAMQIKALNDFGMNLGLAFQIQDDVLDIFGDENKFGKKIGKDIEEHKGGNIVLIYALQELNKNNRNIVRKVILQKEANASDIKNAISVMRETKALERASLLKEKLIKKAKHNLEALQKNKWVFALSDLADFVVNREK